MEKVELGFHAWHVVLELTVFYLLYDDLSLSVVGLERVVEVGGQVGVSGCVELVLHVLGREHVDVARIALDHGVFRVLDDNTHV